MLLSALLLPPGGFPALPTLASHGDPASIGAPTVPPATIGPLVPAAPLSGFALASVHLSPSTGAVGSNVTAFGSGFGAFRNLTATFGGTALAFAQCSLGGLSANGTTITSSPDGTFVCSFVVPAVPAGAAQLVVSGAAPIPFPVSSIPMPLGSWGSAYDPRTGEVFIPNINSGNVIVVNDTTTLVVATVAVGNRPHSAVFDTGTGQLFVANYNPGGATGSVSVISDTTNTVVATVTAGMNPVFLAYDSGKGEVFVTNYGSANVSVISDATDTVVATVAVDANPQGIAYDAGTGQLFVACASGNVVVISDTTNQVVKTVAVGSDPWGAIYDPAKGEVFVTQNGSTTVSVISDTTDQVVGSVTVGVGPTGGAYDPASGTVFVATVPASGPGAVVAINDTTDQVVGRVGVGDVSFSIAYDRGAAELFVPNQDSSYVSVIANSTATAAFTVVPSLAFVSPSSGPAGGTVTLRGSGYAAAASIGFRFNGSLVANQSICTSRANGTFSGCTFVVPGVPAGAYPVVGTDARSNSNSNPLTYTVTATVLPLVATSSVTSSSGPSPFTAQFLGDAMGGTAPYAFAWAFGDGGTSSSMSPSHAYLSVGSYEAVLTVTDSRGGSASALPIPITVTAPAPVPLTFHETGLGPTTSWSVTIRSSAAGATVSTTTANLTRSAAAGSAITFQVSPGPYEYVAGASGYTPVSGVLNTSNGSPASVAVRFVPAPSSPNEGGPAAPWIGSTVYVGVGIAAIAAAGLLLTAQRFRARQKMRGRALVERLGKDDWDWGGEPP